MSDLLKAEVLDSNLIFNPGRYTGPISPWVLKEIAEINPAVLVEAELELQRSIYQAKIVAVDKLLGGLRQRT